jgi:hypothetical protein
LRLLFHKKYGEAVNQNDATSVVKLLTDDGAAGCDDYVMELAT